MRRALIIATENYQDGRFSRLPGTVRDADGLKRVLGDPDIGGFDVEILHDATVRSAGIAISRLFQEAAPDDVLLLHISAHGLRDVSGNLYFITSDTDFEHLWVTALSGADVQREMRNSPARRVILLLDCCYSGAFTHTDGSRGAPAADLDGAMKVRGRIVITASTAVQLSYERTDGDPEGVRSGLFTRAVVRGLETGEADADGNGVIDTHELYRYVTERVWTDAHGQQTPTFWADNVQWAVHIARSARGPLPGPVDPLVPVPAPLPPNDFQPPQGLPPARVRREPTRPVRRLASGVGKLARRLAAALTVAPPGGPTAVPTTARHRRSGPSSRSRRSAVSLLALLGVVGGVGLQADSRLAVGTCPAPTQVRVATSAVGLASHREVADDFERWVAQRSHGCRVVSLYLYPAAPAKVAEGIRAGWPEGDSAGQQYLRDVGPHPDIWLPEAGSDVPTAELGLPEGMMVAHTPLVLGVPRSMASGMTTEQRRGTLSWTELFAKASRPTRPADGPAGLGWGVVRGDPASSTTARLATARLYQEGRLDAAAARRDVEQWIEHATDAAAYPFGDETDLLCRQREIDATRPPRAKPAAVILTEQALVRFNQGRPLAASCAHAGPTSDAGKLVAFYPANSPAVRQQVVELRWHDDVQTEIGRAAARWFARWLKDETAGRRALLRVGLRPIGHAIQDPVSPANGAFHDWPFSLHPGAESDVQTQNAVADIYARARRPGRFLVALDASGSMGTVTADRHRTRFEVSVAAVEGAVARMGGRDEFGLLTFSTERGRPPTRQVVPIARQTPERAELVSRAAARVQPSGDTPLYEAIRRGAQALRAGAPTDDRLRTLVVVTDGRDTSGQPWPSAEDTAGVRVIVIAVGDMTCADSALRRLVTGNAGRCFDADIDALDEVLGGMFRVIWAQKKEK